MSGNRTVRKAIIPVAGRATRLFPASAAVPKGLLPLVDLDGAARAVLHVILRQARAGGIEQFAVVVSPGQEEQFRRYFARHEDPLAGRWGDAAAVAARELADLAERVSYVTQPAPEGLGHAVWCARRFAGDEPVLVLLGDFLFYPASPDDRSPLGELCELYARVGGVSLTAVERRRIETLALHGTLAGEPVSVGGDSVYRIGDIVEKPDPQTARDRLATRGLPADAFLTHAGAYVFGPAIFDALEQLVRDDRRQRGEIQLTAAQEILVRARQDYFAVELPHCRTLDVGTPQGFADAQRWLTDARRSGGPSL